MKINFDTIIYNFDGTPVIDEAKTNIRYNTMAIRGLLTPEDKIPADESLKRYKLAERISGAKEIDITVEEAAAITKSVIQFGPFIHGRFDDLFNKPDPKEKG